MLQYFPIYNLRNFLYLPTVISIIKLNKNTQDLNLIIQSQKNYEKSKFKSEYLPYLFKLLSYFYTFVFYVFIFYSTVTSGLAIILGLGFINFQYLKKKILFYIQNIFIKIKINKKGIQFCWCH